MIVINTPKANAIAPTTQEITTTLVSVFSSFSSFLGFSGSSGFSSSIFSLLITVNLPCLLPWINQPFSPLYSA